MAIEFAKATDWGLVQLDPSVIEGGEKPAGAPYKAPKGNAWYRVETTLIRERFGQVVAQAIPEAGILSMSGGALTMYNGNDFFSLPYGEVYDLEDDQLYPESIGSGMYRHVQVWRHRGEWTEKKVDYEDS